MRLITVAIHTPSYAQRLKEILEKEGISVKLQNVNLETPLVSAGMRVRISEDDLPLALRIIENTDIFTSVNVDKQERSHYILFPVDCGICSVKAAKIAFCLAKRHNADILLLHSYLDPYGTASMQLSDALTFDIAVESEARRQVERTAHEQLSRFATKLRDMMRDGELPQVKFDTKVLEGVPEDVIVDYARVNPPYLTVMGTRGAAQKADEIIGSVTAEVIDKCRASILTVPEPFVTDDTDSASYKPHNVLFFCNLEQEDMLALDTMARIFPDGGVDVTIVHVPGKRRMFARSVDERRKAMLEYCRKSYQGMTFSCDELTIDHSLNNLSEIAKNHNIDLIVVPNKRKNVFSRLINQGIPNRILFNADIPMLVIRV